MADLSPRDIASGPTRTDIRIRLRVHFVLRQSADLTFPYVTCDRNVTDRHVLLHGSESRPDDSGSCFICFNIRFRGDHCRRAGLSNSSFVLSSCMKHLEIISLYKRFRDHSALNGVCLSANKGELLCLLGPSGCGKTTTLRIIAGFESADSGQVLLDGVDIAPVPPQKREIGFVFQSYAL